jgi:hypothetical protein
MTYVNLVAFSGQYINPPNNIVSKAIDSAIKYLIDKDNTRSYLILKKAATINNQLCKYAPRVDKYDIIVYFRDSDLTVKVKIDGSGNILKIK